MIVSPSRPKAPRSKRTTEVSSAQPRHVAIIMDGNGRWAEERGLSRQAGHRAGTENIRRIIEEFARREVSYLTLFAFSTENWSRPRREVDAILRITARVIDRELASLHQNGVRLVHAGSLDRISPSLQKRVQAAIELTKDNQRLTVCLAFNYGGRAEIVEAVRRIAQDGVPAEAIDEALISSYLNRNDVPDPDLVIRTAGEMRLSNFLIWQAAYAEYYSTPVYWPDFDEAEIERAMETYANRSRRFGGLSQRRKPAARNGA